MNILFIGKSGQNGMARLRALRELGHTVEFLDMENLLAQNSHWAKILWRCPWGASIVGGAVFRRLKAAISGSMQFDAVFLNQCEAFDRHAVSWLKREVGPVINYVNDDPFGNTGDMRWKNFLKTVPLLDLLVVVRDQNIGEAKKLEAPNVCRVYMAADRYLHRALPQSEEDEKEWGAEVSFIGTYFPERGPFLCKLIDAGIPLAIYGNGWDHAPQWETLKKCFRGNRVTGDDYIKAIQYSKICLGLLSKKNRDEYTTRTFEIPAIGTLLLAEDTPEHRELFRPGDEAVFFTGVEDCIDKCNNLLGNKGLQESIASRGQKRFLESGYTNHEAMNQILTAFEECFLKQPK